MRVADIVSQTKEYERLQGLINNIETAIEDLGKPTEEPESFITGTIFLSGYHDPKQVKTSNVLLSSGVSELILYDFKELLFNELNRLKIQQEELEV